MTQAGAKWSRLSKETLQSCPYYAFCHDEYRLPDGSVGNVHVTNAEPRRVFDRAAVDAVSRWKFKPALINGVPTAVVLQRRVEFRLSGG